MVRNKPSVRPWPASSQDLPLGGIEMAEDEFKLLGGGGDQDQTFADGAFFEIQNFLYGVLVARICAKPPDSFRGIGQNATLSKV